MSPVFRRIFVDAKSRLKTGLGPHFMKLRLRENSIRLRLLQNEIKLLKKNEFVSEIITFAASQTLIYALKISPSADEIFARFNGGEVMIEIPANTAENWIETDLIGIENEQKIDGGKTLKILIEKDFVCVERPFEADNKDAFPHPKMNC